MNRWEEFDLFASRLEHAAYRFAKTMKDIPHYYTLRKNWCDREFVSTVEYIRKWGHKEWFLSKTYQVFNVNQWKYWTMGAPINENGKPCTILINRTHKDTGRTQYDFVSDIYDSLLKEHYSNEDLQEFKNAVDYRQGDSVLDIGCGTGLFLDLYKNVSPEKYHGVDPSSGMLAQLFKKHGDQCTTCCRFEDFYINHRFDRVISLLGSFSYIRSDFVGKALHYLNEGGRATLMLYAEDYYPALYKMAGVEFSPKEVRPSALTGWDVTRVGNYLVANYTK